MHFNKIDCYGFEGFEKRSTSAKRPGPKSSAQTPALPHEKKEGSKVNKPGSAAKMIQSESDSITFSEKVTLSLKNKVKEHNAKYKKKVTLSQLKKVYRRGAGAFSKSHRPGKTRGQWAMARVNMFLKMVRGGKVKDSYRKADQDVAKGSDINLDFFDEILMDESELQAAQEEMEELGIAHLDFDDVENDLFLTVDEKPVTLAFDIEI